MLNRKPMSRSGFKRPAIERAPRAPLVPVTGCRGVYAPVGGEVVAVPKEIPVRSEPYRRWVASLPCMACKIEGFSQAAHPNQGRGLGQKASDLDCFPLCAARPGHQGCHILHDQLIDMTLAERREIERNYIAHMRVLARVAGRLEHAA
jgi:hypothetical protein